jgi:site-specific recombinase XerD
MQKAPTSGPHGTAAPDIEANGTSFARHRAQGRLTETGIAQMLRRRAAQAGNRRGLHPHLFRHTFAHQWLAEGGSEGDLMRLAGWRSRTMLQRYGSSAATERAVRPSDFMGQRRRLGVLAA